MNKWTFPIRFLYPSKFQQNFFKTHKSAADGCPYKFRSRGTTGSSMCDQDFYIYVVEDVSKNLDRLIVEFWAIGENHPEKYSRNDIHFCCCCHLRRRRALFSKYCMCIGSRVVFYDVTSEYDSTFILRLCTLKQAFSLWVTGFVTSLLILVHSFSHFVLLLDT